MTAGRDDSKPPAIVEIEQIAALGGRDVELVTVCTVEAAPGAEPLPVYALRLGNPGIDHPAIGFFGGVHGLERIGSEVVIAYLRSLVMRLAWDESLHRQLETLRIIFMPVVNPGGMRLATRANPNGVDLMRNAPVEARDGVPWLIGGQRISPSLPWFRGRAGAPMEAESQALCDVVEHELLNRPFSLAVDCHSGFGARDRLWFPHAHTALPIAHLPEIHALTQVYDRSYMHHRYVVEPQSSQYLAHGDLWDHMYLRAAARPQRTFLPFTLEMGSWIWVRKNPRQLFSRHGIFNPLIAHRQQRVLRRHTYLLDFLMRAAGSHRHWVPTGEAREAHRRTALARWYGEGRR